MASIPDTTRLDHAWELYCSGQVIATVGYTAAQAVFALDPDGDSPKAAVEALAGLLEALDDAPAEPAEPTDAEWDAIYQARDEVFPFDFDAWVESMEGRPEPEPLGPTEDDWRAYGAAIPWTEHYDKMMGGRDR